jgi:hypothetical protein
LKKLRQQKRRLKFFKEEIEQIGRKHRKEEQKEELNIHEHI